jgi:hypothetical protein
VGFLRVTRHGRRPTSSLKAGRRRPAPLRVEELEPRTLFAVSMLADVAHPMYEILLPGHAPGQTASE